MTRLEDLDFADDVALTRSTGHAIQANTDGNNPSESGS